MGAVMVDPVNPSDLPIGSTGTIPVRVAAKGALTLIDQQGNTVGNVPSSKGVTVTPTAIAVGVGDVLMELTTGDTRVVRWVSDDSTHWSSAQAERPQFTTQGWIKVGTANLS